MPTQFPEIVGVAEALTFFAVFIDATWGPKSFQPFPAFFMLLKNFWGKKKKVAINFYDKTGLIQEDISVHPKCKTGSKIRN